MKFSKQREVILQTLMENAVHPNADGVFREVRKKLPSISLATVYRNLKQLSDQGVIRSIEGLDGSVRFDHRMHRHHHFFCTCCKKIYDIENVDIPALTNKISEEYGFSVDSFDMTFKGICHNCKHN